MSDIVERLCDRVDDAVQEITTLRAEIERLRAALRDVLSWAHQVAGDTIDMEQREIEIASVERAIAALKEDGDA